MLNRQLGGLTAAATLAVSITTLAAASAHADPIDILFVGNSFTHGRYPPALNYNAGTGNDPSNGVVHDLLCPSLPCTGAEAGPQINPSANPPMGSTLASQLTYLQTNPSAQYNEVGPFSGVAGIFLQMTKEAGLNDNVSLVAVSSATLTGYANNTGNEAGDLALIDQSKFAKVVLQGQSFEALPTTVTVNGQSVPTRGNPTNFESGVTRLVNGIDDADAAAGVANAQITLAQTPPLASYGYTSSNPAQPIFGSSTPAQQGGNKAYAPYIGDPNPIAHMASDVHNAYSLAAATYNAANPAKSHLTVSPDGDAWVTAINLGLAEQDPFLVNEPAGQVDLWDSNPLLACCTVPIGYHPSVYGDYLNALTLFGSLTGLNPESLDAEFDPTNPLYASSASDAFGITPQIAAELAVAAEDTLAAGNPVPEPASLAVLVTALAGSALLGKARRGHTSRP